MFYALRSVKGKGKRKGRIMQLWAGKSTEPLTELYFSLETVYCNLELCNSNRPKQVLYQHTKTNTFINENKLYFGFIFIFFFISKQMSVQTDRVFSEK